MSFNPLPAVKPGDTNKIMLDTQRDHITKKTVSAALFMRVFLISVMILVIVKLFY
jgi:hypothetical protein